MSINTFARKWSSQSRFIAIALALIAAMATGVDAGDDGRSEELRSAFKPFDGEPQAQRAAVAATLKDAEATDAVTLFRAANTALTLKDDEDGAFLAFAASLRADYDTLLLKRTQPDGVYAYGFFIGMLQKSLLPTASERMRGKPEVVSRVLKRLESFHPRPPDTPPPGFGPAAIEETNADYRMRRAKALVAIKQQMLGGQIPQDTGSELVNALKERNLARFEALLKKGANPNDFFVTKGGNYEWVMCDATKQDTLAFLKLALKYGGDTNLRMYMYNNEEWSRPILCAISHKHREAIYLLADHGADIAVDVHQRVPATYTPLVQAVGDNLWDVVYWMLKKREGHVGDNEISSVIREIERERGDPNTDNNVWRFRVSEYLTARGHNVKPYIGEHECVLLRKRWRPNRPPTMGYLCRERNAKPGDIIFLEDPNLHRQDWERAKAGGPRPEPR